MKLHYDLRLCVQPPLDLLFNNRDGSLEGDGEVYFPLELLSQLKVNCNFSPTFSTLRQAKRPIAQYGVHNYTQ